MPIFSIFRRVMPAKTTTTIETVTVVRPLKVISLICLIISFVLLVISLSTTYWLKTHSFHTGLFRECQENILGPNYNPVPNAPAPGYCQSIAHKSSRNSLLITTVVVLLIISASCTFFGILVNTFGLRSNDLHRKYVFYKITTFLSLVTVICEAISLIGFPVGFYLTLQSYGIRNWEFDWSYGVAWGALLFSCGAFLLLICDKEHDEVYYKEKTIYNPPHDLFA